MDIQKYTGIYATSGDVREAVSAGTLHNPYIAIVQDGNYIDWNGNSSPTPPVPPEPVYSAMPLTFEIISGGTIGWEAIDTSFTATIQYSLNNGDWTNITSDTGSSAPTISVSGGDILQFRGNNVTFSTGNSAYNYFVGSSTKFNVYGNIMSLVSSTGFTTATTLYSAYTFNRLFESATSIVSAENLILPATALTRDCYTFMFSSCSNLKTPPELPATTLAPACYTSMFYKCSNLVTAPELPATTLTGSCYSQMFRNCGKLNYIKCLATSLNGGTANWVLNVASSGTFVKHPDMNDWTTGVNGIPSGWTVIDADI